MGPRFEPEEDTSSSYAEEPSPSAKRPRYKEDNDNAKTLRDDADVLEFVEFDPKVKPAGMWEPPTLFSWRSILTNRCLKRKGNKT